MSAVPRGLPQKIWLVVAANGERHFIDKEFLGGVQAWAKGMNATVIEYEFGAIIHSPPPKAKPVPPKENP